MATRSITVVSLLLALIALFGGLTEATYPHRKTHTVKEHQSIQKVIDKANAGDRIIVEHGVYKEQLTIKTCGLELIGKGAVLIPPKKPVKNLCTGLAIPFVPGVVTQAGICIHGKGVKLVDGTEHRRFKSLVSRITDVKVSGFEVRDFSGISIAVVGAKDTKVFENKLVSSEIYGALTVASINTKITENKVTSKTGLKFIGVCMDDKSDVHITHNKIFGYGIGLCVQTNGADVSDNDVSGSCIGGSLDPNIVNIKFEHNYIHDPFPDCAKTNYTAAFGIFIDGADKASVKHNTIKGQTYGIFLFDDAATAAVAEGNKIYDNKISGSSALDIFVASKGAGNEIKRNKCKSSSPAGFCTN